MNLLLVFADQMRGMDTGCAGNSQVRTPNLDRLAAGGVRMTRAFANSPVCTPSRGSLLTGCYPLESGAVANDLPIRTGLPAMGGIFRDAGHATGYIGKWHLDGCPRDKFTPPGERRLGFDYWAVHNCTHEYFNSFYYAEAPERVPIRGYEPETQTDLAIAFLERNRNRPFCLVLSWGPPHNPYDQVPERFRNLYDPAALDLRPNVPAERAGVARRELAGYWAHITALDELFGRLLGRLDGLGLAEETLVVFTSDHGDMLHSQGRVRKQQPWEESISVPLLLRGPGVPGGRASEDLIGIVDILPTILGLAGIPVPEGARGRDLSAAVRGTGPGREEVLLMDLCPVDEGRRQGLVEWRGLRTAGHTYARTLQGPWVLYDNRADPYQQRNLISDLGSRALREGLDRRLSALLAETGDPFEPWPQVIRGQGLVEPWNRRERELNGEEGRCLPAQ